MLDQREYKPRKSALSDWRDYQRKLKKTAAVNAFIKNFLKYSAAILLLSFLGYKIIGGSTLVRSHTHQDIDSSMTRAGAQPERGRQPALSKAELQTLLDEKVLVNLDRKRFDVNFRGQKLTVDTSLKPDLQQFIQRKMQRSTSRYIGIVIMAPATGKIHAMVGFDKTAPHNNPNTDPFAAASVFKIITAAAAIEKCGLNPDTEFLYNGKKHTLYKSQLRNRVNKYSRRITLQEAFAQSVNPVFGKIGTHYLNGEDIERYADAFGFNRQIRFEIPLPPSIISINKEPYHWAEIASGFNNETKISPLHAALIAAAIINQGKIVEPSIVEKITNDNGEILYRGQVATVNQAISPEATAALNRMMNATIQSGTAKKAFRGYRRDRILSRLNIGGKTGSIDNELHDARYDWFVGFAEEKDGPEKIVISVFVAHEKYIGIRASRYARLTIKHYFHDYFDNPTAKIKTDRRS